METMLISKSHAWTDSEDLIAVLTELTAEARALDPRAVVHVKTCDPETAKGTAVLEEQTLTDGSLVYNILLG